MASEKERIADLPDDEKPREKLQQRGASALSDAELLALFFGTGLPGLNAIGMGRKLIQQFGSLQELSRRSLSELMQFKGIGPAKASQLAAIFEFGKRIAIERGSQSPLDSPEAVYDLLGPTLQSLNHESLRVILLNTKYHLIQVQEISHGGLNECIAHPREILHAVITHSAYAFILVHNHPSGDPSPSSADRKLTRQLKLASEHLSIEMLDHIIIGLPSTASEQAYFSFREMGLM
ncbi:MAG: DNA repair protein RadC [Verrucomicrobiales bacterium]|nr:DNA repair protein RadC [Verrucomicrobiales bacterium]